MRVDARNLTCPKPVVLALESLPKLAEGESLEVVINDNVAKGNLTRLAEQKKCDLEVTEEGADTVMKFTPREAVSSKRSALDEAADFCEIPDTSSSVVMFGADHMGEGNEELGHVLVKGLIYALAHQERVPKKMIFFNGGAHLTCAGSESIEDLKELESRGCVILTCGTCLDYLGIRDQLQVGGVTNLYEIAQTISSNPGVTRI